MVFSEKCANLSVKSTSESIPSFRPVELPLGAKPWNTPLQDPPSTPHRIDYRAVVFRMWMYIIDKSMTLFGRPNLQEFLNKKRIQVASLRHKHLSKTHASSLWVPPSGCPCPFSLLGIMGGQNNAGIFACLCGLLRRRMAGNGSKRPIGPKVPSGSLFFGLFLDHPNHSKSTFRLAGRNKKETQP